MKSSTLVSVLLACTVAWIASGNDTGAPQDQIKAATVGPNSGFVGDEDTAKAIAKVVLSHMLTPEDLQEKQFSQAKLKDGVWTVQYWGPKTDINVPIVIQIRQRSGAITKYENPNV